MDDNVNIQSIKEEILNRSFFAFAFLGVPTLATSLSRIYNTGWSPVFLFQIIFVLLLWGGYIFRRRLSLNIKVFSLNIIALVAGLWGAYTWGLAGGWLVLLTLSPVVFSLFYGKKFGLISVLSTTAVLILISVIHIKYDRGMHVINVNENSVSFWVNTIVTYLFLTSPLIILVGETSIFLKNYIDRLKEKSDELVKSNQRVLETNRELLRAKRKAEDSERLKTHFLENISHEIRTPLNGILGFSEILRQNDLSQDERNIYSDFVFENGKKFLSILDNVLYLSGLTSGNEEIEKENIDLPQLMQDLKNRFMHDAVKKGLSLVVDISKKYNTEEIVSDKQKIVKVLSELVDNAIKFTDSGTITIGYHFIDEYYISFFVKDTGIGIPLRKKKIIFDTFMQADIEIARRYGGAGMGLAISKLIVGMLNGSVSVDSTIGKGSVFTFDLELKEQPVQLVSVK